MGRHVAPLRHSILIPRQPVFALSPYCRVLSREVRNTNFIFGGLTRLGLEPTIYHTRGEHANNTPSHRCGFYNEEVFKIIVINTETWLSRGVTLNIMNIYLQCNCRFTLKTLYLFMFVWHVNDTLNIFINILNYWHCILENIGKNFLLLEIPDLFFFMFRLWWWWSFRSKNVTPLNEN